MTETMRTWAVIAAFGVGVLLVLFLGVALFTGDWYAATANALLLGSAAVVYRLTR